VVSSPPYFGLRDYRTAKWEGGDPNCDHEGIVLGNNRNFIDREGRGSNKKCLSSGDCLKCGAKRIDEQFGLEKSYKDYIANTVKVFETFKPKLKDTATIWWNIGDSYSGSGKGWSKSLNKNNSGVIYDGSKPKDLLMIPNRVAIALQDAGWWIRSEIIWHKPNPMPESVRDRPTSCHEKIWLITKNKKYYYDATSIKEPITDSTAIGLLQKNIDSQKGSTRAHAGKKTNGPMKAMGRKKFDKNMGGSGTSFVNHSGYKKADGSYRPNISFISSRINHITTISFFIARMINKRCSTTAHIFIKLFSTHSFHWSIGFFSSMSSC
jgi:DNA modification methylase